MWFSITKDHLPVPFAATHALLQAPSPLHVLLAVPPAPCICHPAVALICCMCHLAALLSPYVPRHCTPRHYTCHHAVPLSLHTPCCYAPCGCMHHLTVPITGTHATHLATTTTTTAVIAPQQCDYHNHHNTLQQPLPP